MKRLYLKLYVAVIATVLVSLVVATVVADYVFGPPMKQAGRQRSALTWFIHEQLPELADHEVAGIVVELATDIDVDIVVWDARGVLLAHSGDEPAMEYEKALERRRPRGPPGERRGPPGERRGPPGERRGPPGERRAPEKKEWRSRIVRDLTDGGGWAQTSPGGRLVGVVGAARPGPLDLFRRVILVLFVALAIALIPIVRRITRRLERVEEGVERWGAGDFSARVPVKGSDEIAGVARRFNIAAERVEALLLQQRRMLASASHELRSPLTRVRMAFEILSESADDEERAKVYENAVRDIEELDQLIGDLLLVARVEAGDALPQAITVDLVSVVRGEAERFEVGVTGGEVLVTGESRMLRRMCRNLLDNAEKYGGDGPLEVRVEKEAGSARVVVADRGPGIPDADKERIFEPFFRRDDHREGRDGGVGLGLALVKQIAEAHGGSVACADRDGGGTSFVVELPLAEVQA